MAPEYVHSVPLRIQSATSTARCVNGPLFAGLGLRGRGSFRVTVYVDTLGRACTHRFVDTAGREHIGSWTHRVVDTGVCSPTYHTERTTEVVGVAMAQLLNTWQNSFFFCVTLLTPNPVFSLLLVYLVIRGAEKANATWTSDHGGEKRRIE